MSATKKDTSEQKPMLQKLAYTREEAAEVLGVCSMTISRLTERGLLRPNRATRRPLYSLSELQRFLSDSATPRLTA